MKLNKKQRQIISILTLILILLGIITIAKKTVLSERKINRTAKIEKSNDNTKKSEKNTYKNKKEFKFILKEDIVDTSNYDIVLTDNDIYISIEDLVKILGGTLQWNSEIDRYIINCLGTHSIIDAKNKKVTNSREETKDINIVGSEKNRKISLYKFMESLDYTTTKLYSSNFYWSRPSDYDVMPVEVAKKYSDEIGMKLENYDSKYRRERLEFEEKYPNKKEDYKMREIKGDKIIYLTIDDGPNEYTELIIDTFKEHNINGTFFLTGKNVKENKKLVENIYKNGNSIGLQGMTGRVENLYSDPEKFIEEMTTEENLIKEIVGVPIKLIRPIYGSYPRMTEPYREAAIEKGYRIWDWEIDSGDSTSQYIEPINIYENVLSKIPDSGTSIVLLHSKKETAEAIPYIIEDLISKGYTFDILTDDLYPYNYWEDERVEES